MNLSEKAEIKTKHIQSRYAENHDLYFNFKKPLVSLDMISHLFSNLKNILLRTELQMKASFQPTEFTCLAGAFENKVYVS